MKNPVLSDIVLVVHYFQYMYYIEVCWFGTESILTECEIVKSIIYLSWETDNDKHSNTISKKSEISSKSPPPMRISHKMNVCLTAERVHLCTKFNMISHFGTFEKVSFI